MWQEEMLHGNLKEHQGTWETELDYFWSSSRCPDPAVGPGYWVSWDWPSVVNRDGWRQNWKGSTKGCSRPEEENFVACCSEWDTVDKKFQIETARREKLEAFNAVRGSEDFCKTIPCERYRCVDPPWLHQASPLI